MTRKDYIFIAKIIKDSSTLDSYGDVIVHKEDLINDLCHMFKGDNNLFDKDRFIKACEWYRSRHCVAIESPAC